MVPVSFLTFIAVVLQLSGLVFTAERFDGDVSERRNSLAYIEPKTIAWGELGSSFYRGPLKGLPFQGVHPKFG